MAKCVPRWRRIIARGVRIAVFGVVANVLICWALVFAPDSTLGLNRGYYDPSGNIHWHSRSWIGRSVVALGWTGPGFCDDNQHLGVRAIPDWVPMPSDCSVFFRPDALPRRSPFFVDGFGLPFRCMYFVSRRGQPFDIFAAGFSLRVGSGEWFFPAQISVIPFIANSSLLGVGAEACMLACGVVRNGVRVKGGRCSICAYCLRGLPPSTTVCPECGAPIPAPSPGGVV